MAAAKVPGIAASDLSRSDILDVAGRSAVGMFESPSLDSVISTWFSISSLNGCIVLLNTPVGPL